MSDKLFHLAHYIYHHPPLRSPIGEPFTTIEEAKQHAETLYGNPISWLFDEPGHTATLYGLDSDTKRRLYTIR